MKVPYIKIEITREGATPEQKAALIEGTTEVLVRVLHKDPASTFVVIQEIDMEDWGQGGVPVDEFRRRARGSALPSPTPARKDNAR